MKMPQPGGMVMATSVSVNHHNAAILPQTLGTSIGHVSGSDNTLPEAVHQSHERGQPGQ
jgi:hypothetical protein